MPSVDSDKGSDRFRKLYPLVDEEKTPLPHGWNPKDKGQFIGISQNGRRVSYRGGQGKTHKDASAVRTDFPIPAACGLYYFEIRVISKGRDGYIGIGLSLAKVNLSRLPGWDKDSFGYHADDGCSFSSSGQGKAYGPTYSTGDVIGCGVNLVDNACFYTKNGQRLGTAFTDLPPKLFPTVGLQTPGETLETNFGQAPFVYDIEDELREVQMRIRLAVHKFCLPQQKGEWLKKLISGYLVHHGYLATSESFNRLTGQQSDEDATSISNRQKIQMMILSGRIGAAIDSIQMLYPGLLDRNPELLLMLKCRQFIEMVNGSEHESRQKTSVSYRAPSHSGSPASTPPYRPPHLSTSKVRQSPKNSPQGSPRQSPRRIKSPRSRGSPSPGPSSIDRHLQLAAASQQHRNGTASMDWCENGVGVENGNASNVHNGSAGTQAMEEDCDGEEKDYFQDGLLVSNGGSHLSQNGSSSVQDGDSEESASKVSVIKQMSRKTSPGSNNDLPTAQVMPLIEFGRELQALFYQISEKFNDRFDQLKIQKMVNDAFALLAYANPAASPLSYLMDTSEREPIAAAVNSTILESQGLSTHPGLEVLVSHAKQLPHVMANYGIGSCAFAIPEQVLMETSNPTDSKSQSS